MKMDLKHFVYDFEIFIGWREKEPPCIKNASVCRMCRDNIALKNSKYGYYEVK